MIPNTLPKGLLDNPRLSRWIGFEEPGRVRVATGKVEIGQGVLTALAQIAAEELDVSLDRIRLVSGDTAASPAEGTTAGSTSVSQGGAALRLAGAEVRALVLARAAELLAAPLEDLAIADGAVLRAGAPTGHDYWTLAREVDLDREATGGAPTKRPADYRVVGTSAPRIDLPAKVVGPAFIQDMAGPDLLHVRVLRRPRRYARLVALDEQAVRRRAGAAIEILRSGDFVAFAGEDETAVMRAQEAAWENAAWEGGLAIPDDADRPAHLRAQAGRDRAVEAGERAPAGGG
ncbi:molybdopterin cofactor-binding domain-containing protein, partial [Propylenella binzhouense]|uniref:molybdopterin cofactor-binding domain-containing protein n=1 Tax=Propylenella binzhouense TaxID=2555902 RepID=UPI00136B7B70